MLVSAAEIRLRLQFLINGLEIAFACDVHRPLTPAFICSGVSLSMGVVFMILPVNLIFEFMIS